MLDTQPSQFKIMIVSNKWHQIFASSFIKLCAIRDGKKLLQTSLQEVKKNTTFELFHFDLLIGC